jgi:hypothetical protein
MTTRRTYLFVRRVARKARRHRVDVIRIAVALYEERPHLFTDLQVAEERKFRLDFRVSKAFRLRAGDLAWKDGLIRSRWLSAIVARLMAVTEETDLVRFLRTGQDLRDYMQKVVADETDNTKSESSGNG